MKTGKISETVLERSVLRQIGNHREEVLKGAGVGNDCALLAWRQAGTDTRESSLLALSTETVALPVKKAAYLAVMAAANNLAASGAAPAVVTLALTIPEDMEEEVLREIIAWGEECCRELGIQIVGGHTEVSSRVSVPVVTAAATGRAGLVRAWEVQGRESPVLRSRENLKIVASKWIGMEGVSIIAGEKEQELRERYPAGLLRKAQEQGRLLSVAGEAAVAGKSGVYAMHDVRNGGIFGALWEISRKLGVGLRTDLKKIPVKQETIEICEFYNINPYELLSGGMLLMLTEDGEGLVRALEREGIPAAVIGETTEGNDKLIINGDETRYLGLPAPDEIHRILFHTGGFYERTDFSDYRKEQPD